eukprot:CAMPEP_0194337012 /NCGR_PEP_ID=MMETSP0171-20130528/74883_1 /TAXON_ID=218684 /ORGANISM="Corethron pennatum, Strain L29A3" /LENGTH=515 /DNA_ID=CAMNT_0039100629 /DNA_START=46 /DNA_END=1589 /DNA_ORIENTATION=+
MESDPAPHKLLDLLDSYTKKISLSVHHAAATSATRQEEGKAASSVNESWTEEDTERTLADCSFEEYLGLKFYLDDPLPKIKQACHQNDDNTKEQTKENSAIRLFVDHEFPTHRPTSVTNPESSEGCCSNRDGTVMVTPGIITDSNCRDFSLAGGKRTRRIRHYMRMARREKAGDGKGGWKWIRGSSMPNRVLFSSSPDGACNIRPRNIIQGRVGNCGFCSGFASLASHAPRTFRDAFGKFSIDCLSSCGAVSLRLYPYPNSRPRYILMDDYVLCDYETSSSYNFESPSLHSSIKEDLWIRLIEKAFVKIQGSYASLDGHYKYNSLYRHPARALQLFTGAPVALEIHYHLPRQKDPHTNCGEDSNTSKDYNIVFDLLVQTQGRFARVVHCRSTTMGLRSNHGYSLLWIGSAAGVKLVCLRNPHGRGSYEGPYGYRSDIWKLQGDVLASLLNLDFFEQCQQTGRVTWRYAENGIKKICNRQSFDSTMAVANNDDDDGIFFMEFSVFAECFPTTTIVG